MITHGSPLQRHGPVTPVSMRSHCCFCVTPHKECWRQACISTCTWMMSKTKWWCGFHNAAEQECGDIPRLCRDGIGRSIFLHERKECIGLAGSRWAGDAHTCTRPRERRQKNAAAPQIKHPVITSQSFSAKCVDAFNPAEALQCSSSVRTCCVDSEQQESGCPAAVALVGRDKARLSKLRPGATRNLA